MIHTCHANDCAVETPPSMFMCRKHWYMVPQSLQNAVWKAYRDTKGASRGRNRAYCTAAADAVEHVAKQEGRDGGNSYRRILNMPNGCIS